MSAAAAAVAGGAGLLGAAISSSSAQNAANQQNQAATAANQQQYTQYQQSRADQQPWLDSGKANLAALNTAMPDLTRQFTTQDFQQQPGYQFQLGQGLQAVQRSAAAKGMLNSTGTEQNINNYAQGMANTSYQQALQNFTSNQQQRFNMMSSMAGNGQNAAQNLGSLGQNYSNAYGSNLMGGANASAAGSMATGNAFNGALGAGANAYNSGNMLNRLFPQQPTALGEFSQFI